MRSRPLGKTGLSVGEIGFGAWAIGGVAGPGMKAYGPTDDAASLAALARAVDAGITFFDTADIYGRGRSEELVGKALAGVRGRIVIATKVGYDFYAGGEVKSNWTRAHITRACDESRRRLKTSHIDIYQLHNPGMEELRRGDVLETLRGLRQAGQIRFIGVSIKTPEEAHAAMEAGVDTIQLPYSFLERQHEGGTFRRAQERGVGIIVREPLCRGLLTGKYSAASTFGEDDVRSLWKGREWERRIAQVDEFRAMVRPGLPLARAALKFVLAQAAVSTVIPGCKTPPQVEENCAAGDGAYAFADMFQTEDVDAGLGGDA